MRHLQKLASSWGARLFRQNTGMAWTGTKIERGPRGMVAIGPRDIVIRNARPFHAGVKGMSDLGGWMPVKITEKHIGYTFAQCTQVEVKLNGNATKEQKAWIDAVNSSGGRAGIARKEDDLERILFGDLHR